MRAVAEASTGKSSMTERLVQFSVANPQKDSSGRLLWLITNGVAVELLTGVKRNHDDLDLVTLKRPSIRRRLLKPRDIDTVTPEKYFAGMNLEREFLESTAQEVNIGNGENTLSFFTVHPAIIMVQKATTYPYGGQQFPRVPKDLLEVRTILEYWLKRAPDPDSWNPVISIALSSLPIERQDETLRTLSTIAVEIGQEREREAVFA
jgi:hypothetical protein